MGNDDDRYARDLLKKAQKARHHSSRLTDPRTAKSLTEYANELEQQAAALRGGAEKAEMPQQAIDAPMGEPHVGPELVAAMKPPEPEDEQSKPLPVEKDSAP